MDTLNIINENKRRRDIANKPYDPYVGTVGVIEREPVTIKNFPIEIQYLPLSMLKDKEFKKLIKIGDLKPYLKEALKFKSENELTNNILLEYDQYYAEFRNKHDFEYFCISSVKIENKDGGGLIPFRLNRGQRKLVAAYEKSRLNNKPIRVVLLKARQWGGSTVTQIYMAWMQLYHEKSWNSVICAHVKDAAITIRAMYETMLNNLPEHNPYKGKLRTFQSAQNIKYIEGRGARITIGSAEKPEAIRSQNVSMAHFSEVALFPNTDGNNPEKLTGSIIGSIGRGAHTMIVYESTAKGIGNFFHELALKSKDEENKSIYDFVFVSWFEIEKYSQELEIPQEEFIKTISDFEWTLWSRGATLENIFWYRGKLSEMADNRMSMMEEFPTDAIEAFQSSGRPVFRVEDLENLRVNVKPPIYEGEIFAKESIAKSTIITNKKDLLKGLYLAFTARNKLRIWQYPLKLDKKISNLYVVSVDTGGRGLKSDFSVIKVFSRYWMMYEGTPELVATWRGHIDHDMLAWKACQIATYYNNALLVFESNTAETENTDGNHSEYIYEIISRFYENLYSRTPADQIKEGVPAKWGFHTNRSTKPVIIDNYNAIIREEGYIERDEITINEGRIFETKKNGSTGNVKGPGNHDDSLMATMIGLEICYELPLPKIINENNNVYKKPIVGESTF